MVNASTVYSEVFNKFSLKLIKKSKNNKMSLLKISLSDIALNMIYEVIAKASIRKNTVEDWHTDPFDLSFLFLYISDALPELFLNVDPKSYIPY
jgi:hypothetical protein